MSIADELLKLSQLKDAGVLTESEFQTQKTRLLGSMVQAQNSGERARALDDALAPLLGTPGVKVVHKNPSAGTATIQTLYARPVNHVLHFILSLFTGGLWIIVWIIAALEARKGTAVTERLSVTDDGTLTREVLSSSTYVQ